MMEVDMYSMISCPPEPLCCEKGQYGASLTSIVSWEGPVWYDHLQEDIWAAGYTHFGHAVCFQYTSTAPSVGAITAV